MQQNRPFCRCRRVIVVHSACFVPGDLEKLTLKLVRARDQTRPPCEFGANPFSGSQDIWFTNKLANKKVTNIAKNRTLRFTACSNYLDSVTAMPGFSMWFERALNSGNAAAPADLCRLTVVGNLKWLRPQPNLISLSTQGGQSSPFRCVHAVFLMRTRPGSVWSTQSASSERSAIAQAYVSGQLRSLFPKDTRHNPDYKYERNAVTV